MDIGKRRAKISRRLLELFAGGRSLERFVRGDVVVIPFPFSDLSQAK